MGLEGLLENVEGSTAAMQLMSKEASAEEQTDYIREFLHVEDAVIGMVGLMEQIDKSRSNIFNIDTILCI